MTLCDPFHGILLYCFPVGLCICSSLSLTLVEHLFAQWLIKFNGASKGRPGFELEPVSAALQSHKLPLPPEVTVASGCVCVIGSSSYTIIQSVVFHSLTSATYQDKAAARCS